MSTNKHTNPAYLSHVHLKGYKSILDTEVKLHPGLNIIIGPNGSGKTNFLEFLNNTLSQRKVELFNKIQGKVDFFYENNDNLYSYIFHTERRRINLIDHKSKELEVIFYEKRTKNTELEAESESGGGNLAYRTFSLNKLASIIIKFGLPFDIQNLSRSISALIHPLIEEEWGKDFIAATSYTYKPIINEGTSIILKDFLDAKFFENVDRNSIESKGIIDKVSINLKKFSPIDFFKIVPEPKLIHNKGDYRVDYLNFEFLIDEKWLNWNQLSDGTKRLFYIISEVTLNEGLCLIEEPEMGVHPNQYLKILNFLKEQAEHKQIIITTHAPKTLDILEDDELDQIILTRYEKGLGTKMRHLSKEEQEHAVKFMREESFFLSDFWTMTSFFDEEEAII